MKGRPPAVDPGARPAGRNRRPYRPPAVVDYGPIARLTAGGSGPTVEGFLMILMTKRP